MGVRLHTFGSRGNHQSELAQQTADQVDQRRTLGFELLADPMQRLYALGVGGFDRHRPEIAAAVGLQQAGGIGADGLAAADVTPDFVGGRSTT